MIFPAGLDLLSPHILASLSSQSFRTNLCLTFCGCHMIQVTSHKSHGSSSDTVTFIRCTRVCRYLICDIEMLLRRILSSRYLIFPFPSRVLILHICSSEIDLKKKLIYFLHFRDDRASVQGWLQGDGGLRPHVLRQGLQQSQDKVSISQGQAAFSCDRMVLMRFMLIRMMTEWPLSDNTWGAFTINYCDCNNLLCFRVKERCKCKFHWCCYVECKTCTKAVELYVCK